MSDETTESGSGTTKKNVEQAPASESAPAESTTEPRAQTKAETKSKPKSEPEPKKPFLPPVDVAKVRTNVARVVWLVCVVFALVLAAAVLLIAIDARRDNDLFGFVQDFARKINFGVFALADPIKDFDEKVPPLQDTKSALFNYGLAAVAWLIIGRIADRVIRP